MSEQVTQKTKLLEKMMWLYCKHHHQTTNSSGLCNDCLALLEYSTQRSRNCKNQKGFCAHCPTPCYAPEKRADMRTVMKYSGPRIAFHHPIWVGKHIMETRRKKREQRKKSRKH